MKYYVFGNEPYYFLDTQRIGRRYVTVREDGKYLCSHFCSCDDWAMIDLSPTSSHRMLHGLEMEFIDSDSVSGQETIQQLNALSIALEVTKVRADDFKDAREAIRSLPDANNH